LIVTTAPIETTAATETTIATTVPETTAPDNSLYIEPGRHQFRYFDENTNDYLDYHLFVPNNPQKDMPLIIFLHGMSEVNKIDALKDYGLIHVE
jgi:predicted peptidase